MRPFDDHLDPEPATEEALAVIDATLAGEAVEPEHAALAELTLILAEQRPNPRPEFTAALDERVRRRFAVSPADAGRRRRARRRWLYAPGAMVGAAAAVAVVIVAAGGLHQPDTRSSTASSSAPSRTSVPGLARRTATSGNSAAASSAGSVTSLKGSPAARPGQATSSSSPSAPLPAGTLAPGAAPAPHTGGRQVVQSAQLSLSTHPDQVASVAQQVFDVVSAQKGVVQSSTVTSSSGSSGYGEFQLSVPSSNLQATMSALSGLHGASVVSRTDGSQDITGKVGGAGRRLADARALRTSLLRQLATATSQSQITSLKAQLRDAEASINSDLATLNALHRQVDNSQISVTINAATVPVHAASSGGGFTIGKAAHDAERVLVVAAGVALIALAVLVPLSLLAAVVAWLGFRLRRRRREQALDLV
jgi:Domain of unknown function (DUF4349)